MREPGSDDRARDEEHGHGEAGTTLVELLVVLALMALIALFMGEGIRAARIMAPLGQRIDASAEVAAVRDHLARTLSEALSDLPLGAAAPFTGEPDAARFLAPADPVLEVDGIQRVTLGLAPGPRGFDLVELRGVARGDIGPDAPLPGETRTVLLSGVEGLSLSYAAPASPGAGGRGAREPDWQARWSSVGLAPALVRVEIALPPGDTRRFAPLVVHPMASPAPSNERTAPDPR